MGLLLKDTERTWEQEAFNNLKEILSIVPVLSLYDTNAETKVSADASNNGLGAVLLQTQSGGEVKPIAYVSRSLSPVEQRYAQIKKEALAFTWVCERLSDYLIEIKFHIQTDHKPLVPLFSNKSFDNLSV
uniref:Reverse transcriptase/retrotransposon-derived protein RNase H-like domain-containing protein n=1 Tax=Amphimedon queenslandica TaxID=400682 RepID=A0A1X7SIP9_AMPQE